MRAREKMPLFMRTAVYRINQKIGPHPQVIEQSVALGRSPVAGEVFLLLFRPEEKCQTPAFGRFDFLSKGQIRLHTLQPCRLFTSQETGYSRVNRVRRILA